MGLDDDLKPDVTICIDASTDEALAQAKAAAGERDVLTVDADNRNDYLRPGALVVETACGAEGCLDFAISGRSAGRSR